MLRLALLFVLVVVATSSVTANNTPAWSKTSIPSGGSSIAGPFFSAINISLPYALDSVSSSDGSKTDIVEFFSVLMENKAPARTIYSFTGGEHTVSEPTPASYVAGSPYTFIFTGRKKLDGTAVSVRWNPETGIESTLNRGRIAPSNAELVDPFTQVAFFTLAVADGKQEMIFAHYKHETIWVVPISIPASHVVANTGYARDLLFLMAESSHKTNTTSPKLALVSLGRLYVLEVKDGAIAKTVESPCGYSGVTDMRMKMVFAGGSGEFMLLLFGTGTTGADAGKTVFCALNATEGLQELWKSSAVLQDSGNNNYAPTDSDASLVSIDGTLFVAAQQIADKSKHMLFAVMPSSGLPLWSMARAAADSAVMPALSGISGVVLVQAQSKLQLVGIASGTVLEVISDLGSCGSCVSTPAVLLPAVSTDPARAVCACTTSAGSSSVAIAFDLGDGSSSKSKLVWELALPAVAATQVAGGKQVSIFSWSLFFDPAATIATQTGELVTISYRANGEPAPTFPPAPTTAAPTMAPNSNAKPAKIEVCAAPGGFKTDSVIYSAIAKEQSGFAVAASAFATVVDTKTNKTLARSVIYYQECGGGGGSSSAHQKQHQRFLSLRGKKKIGGAVVKQIAFEMFDTSVKFFAPVVVYSSPTTNQLSVAFSSALFVGFLFSNPKSDFGLYKFYWRYGAETPPAVDAATGTAFFSTGAFDTIERMGAVTIKGDGAEPSFVWVKDFKSGGANFTSALGAPLFLGGAVLFSFKAELVALSAADGKALAQTERPCGFAPFMVKDVAVYMIMVVLDATRGLAGALVLTAANTWGLCPIDSSTGKPASGSSSSGITIKNATQISTVVTFTDGAKKPIALVDHFDSELLGHLAAFDVQTGAALWSVRRDNAASSVILPVPQSSSAALPLSTATHFVSNMDIAGAKSEYDEALSLVEAASGKVVAQCAFSAAWGTIAWDSANSRAVTIVSVYGFERTVRAVSFSGGKCDTVWETSFDEFVVGFSKPGEALKSGSDEMVELVLQNGETVSVSLAAK